MFEAWQANYKCPETDSFFEFFQSQKSSALVSMRIQIQRLFYPNTDPDPDPDTGSQTNADPDPGHT
jgi:hypothetical protein